jgi:hypothetical protein
MKLDDPFDEYLLENYCKSNKLDRELISIEQVYKCLPYLEPAKTSPCSTSKQRQNQELNHVDIMRILNDYDHFRSEKLKQELADLDEEMLDL